MQKFRLPAWALAWLAILMTGLVVLLANQGAVDKLLAATGLEKLLYPGGKNAAPTLVQAPAPSPTVLLDPVPAPLVVAPPSEDPTSNDPPPAPEPPLPGTPNTYRLYFLKLSPEGRQEPASFARELPAGATPLTATIKALLLGPTLQDKAQGALSMVPIGTKLLSIRLKDKTALLSFSEEFEHNVSGLEGLAGQLKEVVWTATQFASVDSVQILIGGQYRETLGDGGLAISRPLTRSNLP
jgi:spore germination protein GerM